MDRFMLEQLKDTLNCVCQATQDLLSPPDNETLRNRLKEAVTRGWVRTGLRAHQKLLQQLWEFPRQ